MSVNGAGGLPSESRHQSRDTRDIGLCPRDKECARRAAEVLLRVNDQ